jgi:hypothetical protein
MAHPTWHKRYTNERSISCSVVINGRFYRDKESFESSF